MSKKFIGTLDVELDANGYPIVATDLTSEQNALGELPVATGFSGNAKPDILSWAAGTDSYAAAAAGTITAARRKAMVFNTGAACLLSVQDVSGDEKPYVIPNNFVREIVFPFDVAIGAAVTIKNLETGVNAGKIWIEFA